MTSVDQPRRDVYDLVFGLAGRLPDDDIAAMRSALAGGEAPLVLGRLCAAAGAKELALTKNEQDGVRRLCMAFGVDGTRVDEAKTGSYRELSAASVRPYSFSAPDSADESAYDIDEAVISAAIGFDEDVDPDDADPDDASPAARALWRVRRFTGGVSADIRLVELVSDADPVEVTGRIQDGIAELAGDLSGIEVFTAGTELTRYHEEALANATLIWVAEELVIPRVAAVYDGVNPHGEPFFSPDHPRLPEAEQAELARYLSGGERVLGSLGWINDIVTSEEVCVPTGYRSDGTWVWPDATLYYLERHGLAPDPDLRVHMRKAGAPPGTLSCLQRHAALDALLDRAPRPDSAR